MVTISVVILLGGCSAGRVSGVDTLPPLPSPASPVPMAPPTPHQRWYEHHQQALTDQRNQIEVLRDQLAAAPSRDASVMLCVAGQQAQRREYEQARQAPDVHTAWAEAVDLTLWMVASCSAGDVSGVTAILPLIDDALTRFDGWVAESATG